jgi:ABC-type antimicrobial peptide transport system permease subunit
MMAAGGILAGAACEFGLEQLAGSFFESVRATGAWVVAGSAAVLLVAAVVASAVPASRAARVDVIQALRAE